MIPDFRLTQLACCTHGSREGEEEIYDNLDICNECSCHLIHGVRCIIDYSKDFDTRREEGSSTEALKHRKGRTGLLVQGRPKLPQSETQDSRGGIAEGIHVCLQSFPIATEHNHYY